MFLLFIACLFAIVNIQRFNFGVLASALRPREASTSVQQAHKSPFFLIHLNDHSYY